MEVINLAIKFFIAGKKGAWLYRLSEAISMSCDCYFYDLSLSLGIEKISETENIWVRRKVFR